MDFSQEIPPLLFGDAPLKDSGCAFLIKLSLVDLVGFRSPYYAVGLILVFGEFGSVHGAVTAIISWAEGLFHWQSIRLCQNVRCRAVRLGPGCCCLAPLPILWMA